MENHSSRKMAHGDPRPARTPSSREQRSSFFHFFYEAIVQHVTYVTHFCRVDNSCIPGPFMENDPPQFSIFRRGRRSCAATCQMTREDGAIIDICLVVFGSIALFSLHARGSSL